MGERPPFRTLVRLGALVLGPARAHRQDLWPHLAIDPGAAEARWRGRLLTRLTPFSEVVPRHADFLAIVGSGPSLRDQRPDRLPPRSSILLNGAASLVQAVPPLAIAVEDERFVFRHWPMIKAAPPDVPLFLSPAALRALAERDEDLFRGRTVCLIDNLAKPVNRRRRALDHPSLAPLVRRGHVAALSTDPDEGVVITGTVALSALQIALAATPRRLLLAGIDLGNAAEPRFYEGDDRAPSGLAKGLPRILAGFALARDEAAAHGIAIECASPVSALLTIGYPLSDCLDSPAEAAHG